MNHHLLQRFFSVMAAGLLALASFTALAQEGPDQLIRRLSADVLDTIKTDKEVQAGDQRKIVAFVDGKVMPHVNFTRMTASAVGRAWRQATPEDLNVLGVWLVETYRSQFAQEINARGIDGLITALAERNKASSGGAASARKV